jgi:hypothetical protein
LRRGREQFPHDSLIPDRVRAQQRLRFIQGHLGPFQPLEGLFGDAQSSAAH